MERVVNTMWRLQRSARAETALFHWRVYSLKAMRLRAQVTSYEKSVFDGAPVGTWIADEASHSEAMEAVAEAESERDRDEVLLGCAFHADAKDGDAIAKLARYERGHEQSLFRNLCELRRMQEKRGNRRSSSMSDVVTSDADDTQ